MLQVYELMKGTFCSMVAVYAALSCCKW